MKSRILALALLSAGIAGIVGLGIAASGTTFQDVLDTPALKSPLAAKAPYNGIALAGNRLVAVGQRGHIVYSDDRGKSWNQASVPASSDLTAVNFPSPKKGWAVGHDGVVLHSADAGATWTRQLDGRAVGRAIANHHQRLKNCASCHDADGVSRQTPSQSGPVAPADALQKIAEKGPEKSFLGVWFENETSGYVVGAFNLIFRTADGGKTWEPLFDRTENPKRFHLYGITAVGPELYLSGEHGLILKLDRRADRFVGLPTPYEGTFFGITGKAGTLIAYGLRGTVLLSRDAGKSWKRIETGIPVGVTAGAVTDDGGIALVNLAGNVLVSSDQGATFTPARIEQPFPTSAVLALDDKTLMLAGPLGLKKQPLK